VHIVEAAGQAEDVFGASYLTPQTALTIRRLVDLTPTTLAVMHGSCFSGDGPGRFSRWPMTTLPVWPAPAPGTEKTRAL
jgi:hypothetical protein